MSATTAAKTPSWCWVSWFSAEERLHVDSRVRGSFPSTRPHHFPCLPPLPHSRAKNEKCRLNEREKDSQLFNKTTMSLIGKRGQTPGLPMTPVQCPGKCPETHEGIQCSVQSHRFINDYHREFDPLKWICLLLCFILIAVL